MICSARRNGPYLFPIPASKAFTIPPRNLADAQAKAIAEKGGLVGIGFWPDAIGPGGLAALVRMIAYAVDLLGEDQVALGSDFDGMVPEPFDAAAYPLITDALLQAGMPPKTVAKLLGENAWRFFSAMLPQEC